MGEDIRAILIKWQKIVHEWQTSNHTFNSFAVFIDLRNRNEIIRFARLIKDENLIRSALALCDFCSWEMVNSNISPKHFIERGTILINEFGADLDRLA